MSKATTSAQSCSSSQEYMLFAIKNSQSNIIKTLLTEGTIVTSSFIRHALFFGTEDIVRLLFIHFKRNSTPDVISPGIGSENQESNLLDELQDSEDLIKALLRDGKLSLSNKEKHLLLIFFAAKIGKANVLQLILNNRREYLAHNKISAEERIRFMQGLNIYGESGETALHFAVSQQHVDAVRFLLDQGADPNCKSNARWTPLHYAALRENYEICQLLLNSGAKPNEYGKLNPLHLVCGYRLHNVHLQNFHDFTTDLFNRFNYGDIFNNEIMKLLLKNGADPNKRYGNRLPLLLQVCRVDRLEAVKTLLEFGVDIKVVDDTGNTALHYAVKGNSIQIVEFLLKQGLEIDKLNNKGNTPLMFALHNDLKIKPSTIEYIVDRRSSISIRNNNNETALDLAVHYNNPNVVLTLFELGAHRILKSYSDPNDRYFGPVYCPFRSLTRQIYNKCDSLQALISYIMLKEVAVNDYRICCFQPIYQYIEQYFGLTWNELQLQMDEFKYMLLEKTKLEMKKLKLQKILKEGAQTGYSYFDFLMRDFSTAIRIIKNPTMRLELSTSKEQFPRSFCLLQHRFNLAVDLENCFDNIVNFFLNYKKVRLPIDVIENILCYLSRRDIQIFGEILSEVKY